MPAILENEDQNTSLLDQLQGQSGNPFLSRLQGAAEAVNADQLEEAERLYKEALELYPQYIGLGNPYVGLGDIYKSQGKTEQQIDVLKLFLDISEHGAAQAFELGQLYKDKGQTQLAASYIERSLQVAPYQSEVHSELGELYTELGQHRDAIRARKAVIALDPVDKSRAYYNLALSYHENGSPVEAKRATLQSLEIAPGFREAQKLLLELVPRFKNSSLN